MPTDAMRFILPPDQWPADRRTSACRVAMQRARSEVRAGKRALDKGDCGVADLHRIAAAGMLEAARGLCGACSMEKLSPQVDEAFGLSRGVSACGRE